MGGRKLGFSGDELTTAKQKATLDKVLSEIELVLFRETLIDMIESHHFEASKKAGFHPLHGLSSCVLICSSRGLHLTNGR